MENLNRKNQSLLNQSSLLSQLEILKDRNKNYKFAENESLFMKDSWVRYKTTYIKSEPKKVTTSY